MNSIKPIISRLTLVGLLFFLLATSALAKRIHFIHISDLHYGLYRDFHDQSHVPSYQVIQAMIDQINRLPQDSFPKDGGVDAGNKIYHINFIVNTGDITNRMEKGVQTAATSWAQFITDWTNRLTLKDGSGHTIPIYLLPGNHDASNAIGFYKPMKPLTDASSMVNIYNMMMKPTIPKTGTTFNYLTDKIHYSFTNEGIHYVFAGIWPDQVTRKWIAEDIDTLSPNIPVIIFAHDPPMGITRHFINPNGKHDINAVDKFENLLSDTAKEYDIKQKPIFEEKQLKNFLKSHSSIKAYFHGHTNYNEFYWWKDKSKNLLPIFRVDSPMKGELSSTDESQLSFILVSIDTDKLILTAREYLWNNKQEHWGESVTIKLR